jgi:5-methylcytosine-specific restriction endonuclease McrA
LTKKRGANGSHTLDDFKVLCQLFRGRCVKCLKVKPLTRDHIVPISKGGTDNIDNIQPMCQSCNSSKSDNTADYRLIAQRLRIR